MVFEHG